jgi:dTDP-4-amino-4,6-dideoxygalactose transaminase
MKSKKKVPFLDLKITDTSERKELLGAIEQIFDHGRIILGPEVLEFEETMAQALGRKFAVGVNSGTDALFLSLKALGITTGDEVITTALSWVATANAIALTGATPVFADIRDDLNIDPVSVKKLITKKTKAIVPVHYTGKICRMDELMVLARENGLLVVEDAAQAFGATRQGRKAGSFGTLASFSMNAMKVFASCGEAGAIVLDDEKIYQRLVALRYNGTVNREECIEVSLNGRIDTLQAAILLKRLPRVDKIISRRREIVSQYTTLLQGCVDLPSEKNNEHDVYYTYTICTDRRDDLKKYLEDCGVETKVHHPILMPDQPAFANRSYGQYPNASRLVKKILSLPCNEKLTFEDVEYVGQCIKKFFKK